MARLPYSLSSPTDPVTSCILLKAREVIKAELVELGDLCNAFSKVAEAASDKKRYYTTLTTVLNMLTSPSLLGGVIFVVVDKRHKNDMEIATLDKGCLNQVCRMKARNIDNPFFPHLLHAFCTPTESDRWEKWFLDNLAPHCGESLLEMSSELAALKMQPKDGAFVLSHSGTVLAAAVQLEFIPQHYQLCKSNGIQFGTCHSAALATAKWMRLENVNGVVFVRSNAGDVHVMLPHGLGEDGQKLPLVLCIEDCKREKNQES